MPTSVLGQQVRDVFERAASSHTRQVVVDGNPVPIVVPFASPADWRDQWIYFLLIDRFNNPSQNPASTKVNPPIAFDAPFGEFQGGTFEGVKRQLGYIRDLGVGAIWLSPVFKNCQYDPHTFHGYGIQDFLHAEPRFSSDPNRARTNPDLADDELAQLVDEIHARGMYAIFDVVLNHAGSVFGYVIGSSTNEAEAEFRATKYAIRWHDENGDGAFDDDFANAPQPLSRDAAVWPLELQNKERFRRQGRAVDAPGAFGDFQSLKQIVSENPRSADTLIRAYQYIVARFDCDGFRIDTFKVPDPAFGHLFCASMREFGLSIGKENFFTFGEITVDEANLRKFIGRDTRAGNNDTIGIDSALDFPVEGTIGGAVKHADGQSHPPQSLADLYELRKQVEREVITTHGEASGFFVTFLDNHDRHQRFYFDDAPHAGQFNDQLTLALGTLFGLQGIPCVYYGTELGLHGIGNSDAAVREALWGRPGGFDKNHQFYKFLQELAKVRATQPAMRYGRQYFRQISGNGRDFAVSTFTPGVIAFSRILNAHEVLVVANTATDASQAFSGEVIVDAALHSEGSTFRLLVSNHPAPSTPGPVRNASAGTVEIREMSGSISTGPARVLPVTVRPMEVQVMRG